jgi:hypothetical protein
MISGDFFFCGNVVLYKKYKNCYEKNQPHAVFQS